MQNFVPLFCCLMIFWGFGTICLGLLEWFGRGVVWCDWCDFGGLGLAHFYRSGFGIFHPLVRVEGLRFCILFCYKNDWKKTKSEKTSKHIWFEIFRHLANLSTAVSMEMKATSWRNASAHLLTKTKHINNSSKIKKQSKMNYFDFLHQEYYEKQ